MSTFKVAFGRPVAFRSSCNAKGTVTLCNTRVRLGCLLSHVPVKDAVALFLAMKIKLHHGF